MKIYLLEDVKGKGKKYDLIEVPNGYGTFLIGQKMATLYTKDSEKLIQSELNLRQMEIQSKIDLATEIKNELDGREIKFQINPSPKGTPVDTVTKKDIINKLNITLDAKDLITDVLKTYGKHEVKIKIYKDIVATIYVTIER